MAWLLLLGLWALYLPSPATASPRAKTVAATAATSPPPPSVVSQSLMHQANKTFSHTAAGKLAESLGHQMKSVYHTPKAHEHRTFLQRTFGKVQQRKRPQYPPGSLAHIIRVGLAGGIAGATGTLALFPVDTAKTIRQANPALYANVRQALAGLIVENGKWHIGRAYAGALPATLGAIPSSALYFGAYEGVKPFIKRSRFADTSQFSGRFWVHSLSAAAGNVLSRCVRRIYTNYIMACVKRYCAVKILIFPFA